MPGSRVGRRLSPMPDQGAEVVDHLRRIEEMTDATRGHIALDDPLGEVIPGPLLVCAKALLVCNPERRAADAISIFILIAPWLPRLFC